MCVNQGFGKGHIENGFGKGVYKVFSTKASGSSIGYKKGRSKPMANTTKNGSNHRNDSKMCKTEPVFSEAWAELSPPQRKERSRRNEEELGGEGGGGGVQVRRGKNPRQGENLDKTKTKQTVQLRADKTQDTPAGQQI